MTTNGNAKSAAWRPEHKRKRMDPRGRVPAQRDKGKKLLAELEERYAAVDALPAQAYANRQLHFVAVHMGWAGTFHEFKPHDFMLTQCGLCWGWSDDYRHLGENVHRLRGV